MGSSIILKLVNVTHYYRNRKHKKWYLPFGYDAEDIDLNNITLHIYEGEALGIIGEPGSSKALIGRILAGDVKPDKGRLVRKASLFYGDVEDRPAQDYTVADYVREAVALYPYRITPHKALQIIKYAHLEDDADTRVCDLSKKAYAQLLFALARASRTEIILLNQVLHHLDDAFFEKSIALAKEYIDDNKTIIFIDDDVSRVRQATNYITWISHGQIRMEGAISQVVPVFEEHERDRKTITTDEARASFDLDWKLSRTRIPEMTYNFRRIERYNHAKPPKSLTRIWTWSSIFIAGIVLSAVMMFNNLGHIAVSHVDRNTTIENAQKDPFDKKLAYGISLSNELNLQKEGSNATKTVPRHALLTIIGENKKDYRIVVDGENYVTNKNNIRYFNPAALYGSHEMSTLTEYLNDNYLNYIDFYNSHLHKSHKSVNSGLNVDDDGRFKASVESQPISLLFNDNDKLTGFTFDIKNKKKLKSEFNINTDFWIVKTDKGYLMADMNEDKWIYIEL